MIDFNANLMNLGILLYQVVLFSFGFYFGFMMGRVFKKDDD